MVVSTADVNSELFKQLVNGNRHNLFNVTVAGESQVAEQLVQRVRTIAQGCMMPL